jgi:hypothetical protein
LPNQSSAKPLAGLDMSRHKKQSDIQASAELLDGCE